MLRTILKLILTAIVSWVLGLLFISTNLYFTNDGIDFTLADIMGFGVMAIVASGLLMLAVYLPSLYVLKRRLHGLSPRLKFVLLTGILCNLPIFIALAFLVNRKMALTEAIGFMTTFLIIGAVFGLGFTLSDEL